MNKKILVIEDDAKIAAALAIRLEAAAYEVVTAADGLAGLALAIDEHPDLIVTDIWMPIGLGFSVAQRLQNMGLAEIPIIFITGSKLQGLKETVQRLGAAAFFEKPYDARQLLDTIARILGQGRCVAC
jgi:DNA-binding response OmpR family regulator